MSKLVDARIVETDGVVRVLSPGVGWWSEIPDEGSLVGHMGAIGALRRLNRVWMIRVPRGMTGRVVGTRGLARRVAVGYGDELFKLEPIAVGASSESADTRECDSSGRLAPGQHAITAPTDGVFYARPTPDAPLFVTRGSRIRTGQPLGLVEVMKTFNQIIYGGDGFPGEVEVVEVRCADGAEIEAGEILFVVKAI